MPWEGAKGLLPGLGAPERPPGRGPEGLGAAGRGPGTGAACGLGADGVAGTSRRVLRGSGAAEKAGPEGLGAAGRGPGVGRAGAEGLGAAGALWAAGGAAAGGAGGGCAVGAEGLGPGRAAGLEGRGVGLGAASVRAWAPKCSRTRLATGGSTAEEAALTNSPWSLSQVRITLEVTFLPVGSSSLASS